MDNKLKIFIKIIIASVIFCGIGFFLYQSGALSSKAYNPETVRQTISSFGPWAFIVYILFFALNTVTVFPPLFVMALSAGFLFNPIVGILALMLGSVLGTSFTFMISRLTARRSVEKMEKGKWLEFEKKLNRNGFITILLIRLFPVLPWEIVNYASGLSKITYRDYIFGTIIGIFPSAVLKVVFADRLLMIDVHDPVWVLSIVLLFAVLAAPAAVFLFIRFKGARTVGMSES